MDPKYVAEKGRRGVEVRCWMYVHGPIMAAHDSRNNSDPRDHLVCHADKLISLGTWNEGARFSTGDEL